MVIYIWIPLYSVSPSNSFQHTVLHKSVLWLYTWQYCSIRYIQVNEFKTPYYIKRYYGYIHVNTVICLLSKFFSNTVLHTTVIWLYACQFRYILYIQVQVKVFNIPYGMKRYYGYMHVCRPRLEIPAIQGSARTAEISPRRGLSVAMSISRLSARH
jgi:hypothetical protein